ncbi:MAG: biopolymer transporter ExbD [Verrucomicrobia bacterium]|nr:biopolymer transporter ExbD [Verrucomicrobiota bacterium]
MARNFRRQRSAHPIADLNVTNLIDLGFMLLVIFMIATPLIQQEQTVGVNLPTVAKAPQAKVKPDEKFVAVAVDTRGFYVDNQPTPLTLAQLRSRLSALAADPKPPVIRIRGDATVPYQRVADLITEVQKAGLTRVTFDAKTVP